MSGVLFNVAAVIVGSLLGLLFKKGISETLSRAVMIGVGLCTVYIGISGLVSGVDPLVAVLSIVPGALIGTAVDLDGKLTRLAGRLSDRFGVKTDGSGKMTEGFVTASLLFCIGAMAVMGSITAGLTGDNSTLYTKSIIDGIAAIMLASTFGIGVIFSAVPVLLYQGAIALFAGLLAPVLTEGAIAAITCVGSILILALGLNIAGISKIKIANYLPAILFSPFVYYLLELLHERI